MSFHAGACNDCGLMSYRSVRVTAKRVLRAGLTWQVASALSLAMAMCSEDAHAQTKPATPAAALSPSPAPTFGGATAPANAPASTSETPPLPAQGSRTRWFPLNPADPCSPPLYSLDR